MDVIIENGSMCVFHRVAIWIVKSMLINGESRALPVFPKFTFRSHGMRFSVWKLLRVQRVISKWNWSIVLIDQFPPVISPNSQGTFHSVHDLSCLLSGRIAFAMAGTRTVRARVRSDQKYISRNYVLSVGRWRTARAKVHIYFQC